MDVHKRDCLGCVKKMKRKALAFALQSRTKTDKKTEYRWVIIGSDQASEEAFVGKKEMMEDERMAVRVKVS